MNKNYLVCKVQDERGAYTLIPVEDWDNPFDTLEEAEKLIEKKTRESILYQQYTIITRYS